MRHVLHLLVVSPQHAVEVEQLLVVHDRNGLTTSPKCMSKHPLNVPESRMDNVLGPLITDKTSLADLVAELSQGHIMEEIGDLAHMIHVFCREDEQSHVVGGGDGVMVSSKIEFHHSRFPVKLDGGEKLDSEAAVGVALFSEEVPKAEPTG